MLINVHSPRPLIAGSHANFVVAVTAFLIARVRKGSQIPARRFSGSLRPTPAHSCVSPPARSPYAQGRFLPGVGVRQCQALDPPDASPLPSQRLRTPFCHPFWRSFRLPSRTSDDFLMLAPTPRIAKLPPCTPRYRRERHSSGWGNVLPGFRRCQSRHSWISSLLYDHGTS